MLKQLETEYVEGDYEDEDDLEDFDGLPTEDNGSDDDDDGKFLIVVSAIEANKFSFINIRPKFF